ncbi:MAG TPA: EAL domain-containing protein [Chloroflexota bacterium]|nr:EAL domain-containing protein [Chloroflexota bacterium]
MASAPLARPPAPRLRELAFLQRIVRAAAVAEDEAGLMQSIVHETNEATGTQVCSLYLWDESEQRLTLTATNGLSSQAVGSLKMELGEGITGWVAENRRPLAVEDVRRDKRFSWIPNVDDDRFISMLSVPIAHGGRLLGVLNVQTDAHRLFSQQDIDFFEALAANLASIIAITGLHRELSLARALQTSQEQYRRIVETAAEGIWTLDAAGKTIYANQQLCRMLGYQADDLLGRPIEAFTADGHFRVLIKQTDDQDASFTKQTDTLFLRKDGSELWAMASVSPVVGADGAFIESLVMLTDVTERRQAEEALKRQALHDGLTDLPNRTLLEDRLAQALKLAERHESSGGLLLLDLDRFKEVNDGLGHFAGDELLRQIGPRLRAALRQSDTVARWGGDEFMILLPDARHIDAASVAAKLLEALEAPFQVGRHSIRIGASAGVVMFPEDGADVETLIRRADLAMYRAKRDGGGWALYASEEDQGGQRILLSAALRAAIDRSELELNYQPKVSLASGCSSSVEALARWHHPDRGQIPPGIFIPLAEQTGTITALSHWVLNQAARQARDWQRAGLNLSIAVNLPMRSLRDVRLPEHLQDVLTRHEVPAAQLKLEITESMIMAEPERTIAVLTAVAAMGIQLSVDDFGTGYSSLAHLARLPVSEIKIDKSFVIGMDTEPRNALIVRSTIDLAHNLGLRVVAEGVERREVMDELAQLGCDEVQGYFLARPMPAAAMASWATRAA